MQSAACTCAVRESGFNTKLHLAAAVEAGADTGKFKLSAPLQPA